MPIKQIFYGNYSSFERNIYDSIFDSAVEDYSVDEDVLAAYIMGRWDSGPLTIIGGFRFEDTENRMRGNLAEEVAAGDEYDGVVVPEDTVFLTSTVSSREYDDVYPSLNIRYELDSGWVLRAGYYESLVRPNISWLAPRFEIDDDREGTFGNPGLQAYQAENFDISAAWYFTDNAVLSAGIFTNDIRNFIAVAEFEDVDLTDAGFVGISADEAEIPINGDTVTVDGLEISYQHALTSLGGPWNGLILGLNYTYTDTEGLINGRMIPLPETSESVVNGVIGYEKNRWSLTLATTIRDDYLDEIDFTGDADQDRWVRDHMQWDLSAKYKVSDSLQVFLDFINVTDEPYVAYRKGPIRDRLLQYEEYSWTGKFGFRMNF